MLVAVASTADGAWLAVIALASFYLFLTLWLQDAFLIAEESRPPQSRRPLLYWLPFLSSALVVFALLLGGRSIIAQLCGVVGLLTYLVLIYRAAAALVRAEGKVSGGTPTFNAISLAGLGLFYFPLGVWFIRPRLKRLRDYPYGDETTPDAVA